jgi:iron complex outermembrane recepter protein
LSITGLCAGACILATPVPARGDEEAQSSSDSFALEEVVVTAQKRRETLQDIPLAISAVSAEALERSGSRSFNDYIRSVPGVAFVDRGPTENKLIIRGVSDGPFAPTAPTTGVYIDEAPVTEPNRNADLNMFDVERVEVLRGPQGTLYGAGSMGGTVRVILNKPAVDAFAATVDTTLSTTSHGDEGYAVNGMINLPIASDKFAIRAVGYSRQDGGFIDDVARGLKDINQATVEGGRVLARLVATDRLTIQAGVTHQETDADGRPQEDLALGHLRQARLFPERLDAKFDLYNLEIDYDFGAANLVSSTSYYDKDALTASITPIFSARRLACPRHRPSASRTTTVSRIWCRKFASCRQTIAVCGGSSAASIPIKTFSPGSSSTQEYSVRRCLSSMRALTARPARPRSSASSPSTLPIGCTARSARVGSMYHRTSR